ncbi:hypothetical protein, partial [Burkholderia stabilis]
MQPRKNEKFLRQDGQFGDFIDRHAQYYFSNRRRAQPVRARPEFTDGVLPAMLIANPRASRAAYPHALRRVMNIAS